MASSDDGTFVMDYGKYLDAKTTVDDRALNKDVWNYFTAGLAASYDEAGDAGSSVIEIGCGTGSMLVRLLGTEVYAAPRNGTWVAVDEVESNLVRAVERIQEVAAARPDELSCTTDGLTVTLKWTAGGDGHTGLVITFVCSDFYAFASDHSGADVVVSCAFLDLVPLDTAIPAMRGLGTSGGLYYFPINFDGATQFMPVSSEEDGGAALDDAIEDAFHARLDAQRPNSGVRCGRDMFAALPDHGCKIDVAGSSSWAVYGVEADDSTTRTYPGTEDVFVLSILYMMNEEVVQSPDAVSPEDLAAWMARRRAQVADGSLVYLAHNVDFVGHFRG